MTKIALIGAGPANLTAACKLCAAKDVSLKIFESGNAIASRKCPVVEGKSAACLECPSCAIMHGFGGCGSYSDGKFLMTTDYGGNVHTYIGKDTTMTLMRKANELFETFAGSAPSIFKTTQDDALFKTCLKHDLRLLTNVCCHYGTDKNTVMLNNMFDFLCAHNVEFAFNTHVDTIKLDCARKFIVTYTKKDSRYSDISQCNETYDKVIIATGRSGSKWLASLCDSLGINRKASKVDLGVRVELPASIWDDITDNHYEAKIVGRSNEFEDSVRTFCMNPHGKVVIENTNGLQTVNGHSYEQQELKTDMTNFALLVSFDFPDPFHDSTEYAKSIIKLSNLLGNGPIVQRFTDMEHGRRSTASRIAKCAFAPTLSATPGDLNLVLPYRVKSDISDMLRALDAIAPGTAGDNTLLYGVEAKFYNDLIEVNNDFETIHKGLYVIGDCSGISHSWAHAAVMGMQVAEHITN